MRRFKHEPSSIVGGGGGSLFVVLYDIGAPRWIDALRFDV